MGERGPPGDGKGERRQTLCPFWKPKDKESVDGNKFRIGRNILSPTYYQIDFVGAGHLPTSASLVSKSASPLRENSGNCLFTSSPAVYWSGQELVRVL